MAVAGDCWQAVVSAGPASSKVASSPLSGSVVVSGTEFDTRNAEIIINGELVGIGDDFVPDNLELGMVVTVEGRMVEIQEFVADRVLYNPRIIGPVEKSRFINDTTKEIAVLGQTVMLNVITKFKGTDIEDIEEDDVISVSGFLDDNGVIRATFLEKIDDGALIFEVTGFVANLNPDLNIFMINDLRIDYESISGSLPAGIPADGQLVEVSGDLVGGELVANSIAFGDELDAEDGDEVEIAGFVTDVISKNDIIKFKIGNQEIHVDSDPEIVEYVDGDPTDIKPGQKLEAEGSLENGILVAVEIEFWEPDQIEVEGFVDDVMFVGGFPEFTYDDRGDQLIKTNEETEFENIENEKVEPGLYIEIKGVPQDIMHSIILADKVSLEID